MKRFFTLLALLLTAGVCLGATTITKVSEFSSKTAADNNDYILLSTAGVGNYKITFSALASQIAQLSGVPVSYVTVVESNLYFSTTNISAPNNYVSNYFATNVYNDTYISNFLSYENLVIADHWADVFETNFYFYSTNIYTADTYVSNYFTTNVLNDTYVSNFFQTNIITTNLYTSTFTTNWYNDYDYISNFFSTNILVDNTYVSNYFTTNLYSTFNTNITEYYYTTNLYNDTYVSNFFATNIFVNDTYVSNYFTTNMVTWNSNYTTITTNLYSLDNTPADWDGPTNDLPLHLGDQNYLTYTPCEITGITSKSNSVTGDVLLTLYNGAATNIELTIPATVMTGDYARAYTISNGAIGMLSLKYTPALGGRTNAVFRDFK